MRYFVLYHYGGIYADLDIEFLHPLEDILSKHSCILAEEPLIHALFNFESKNLTHSFISNAIMACRPRHPFFKLVIENLGINQGKKGNQETTGPLMLDDMLKVYMRNRTSLQEEEVVYVAPSEYFLPTWDWRGTEGWMRKCQEILKQRKPKKIKETKNEISKKKLEMCRNLIRSGFRNEPTVKSYTNHLWQHTYLYGNYSGAENDKNINVRRVLKHIHVVDFD